MAFIVLVALIAAGFVVYYTIKKTEDEKPSEPVAPVVPAPSVDASVLTPEELEALERSDKDTNVNPESKPQ